jgi:hypothetical protein
MRSSVIPKVVQAVLKLTTQVVTRGTSRQWWPLPVAPSTGHENVVVTRTETERGARIRRTVVVGYIWGLCQFILTCPAPLGFVTTSRRHI